MKPPYCPEAYSDYFSRYYDQFIEPQLPTLESLKWIHSKIVEYVHDTDLPLVVRKFSLRSGKSNGKFSARGFIYRDYGREFICSDNEAALWFYARAVLKDYQGRIGTFDQAIAQQTFPIGFSTNSSFGENKNAWKNWGKEKWEHKEFSGRGWLHAHLFDASKGFDLGQLNVGQLKIRCIRYLHPANHFPVPSSRRFVNLDLEAPKDFGAIPQIKAFIFNKYKARYSDIWNEFLVNVNGLGAGNSDKSDNYLLSYEKKMKAAS